MLCREGKLNMRLPIISVMFCTVAVALAVPAFADSKQQKEEVAVINELKAEACPAVMTESEINPVDESVDVAETAEAETETYASPYDFAVLKEENSDIVAWIEIPNTAVDYPVVFDGTDEYLHKNIEGEKSSKGSIYVDSCETDMFNDEMTIIYGHNMKSGSMFHYVDKMQYDSVWSDEIAVNVYLPEKEKNLHPIFCVVGPADATLRIVNDIDTLKEFCSDKDIVQGEIPETWSDMTTLVTCNYSGDDYRTYVFCAE